MKTIVSLIVVAALVAGGVFLYLQTQAASAPSYRFAEVKRGRLVATVGSTGTLQPRETVDVGAQVNGPITLIGEDKNTQSGIVDWGSVLKSWFELTDSSFTLLEADKMPQAVLAKLDPLKNKKFQTKEDYLAEVTKLLSADELKNLQASLLYYARKGTVLAQIDPALYAASVNSAQAAVRSAQADLLQKTATLHQATADWNRAQSLLKTAGVAQAEYDQYKATYEVAQANVEVSKAQIGVQQANLKTALTNLSYTTIMSPVNGTVIDRRVNVGQTVVSTLSAASLFLIAKDLTKMEVWATVNEVDVLKVKAGQDVSFTVDAYPGRIYKGKVVPQGKLSFRLNATMNNNVVTYTAVVSVDNSDDTLRPYLTANLNFIVADKKDVVLVPNAALRWQPSKRQMSPDVQEAYNRQRGKKRVPGEEGQEHGFVWVPGPNGLLTFIEVITGVSDAVNSELISVVSGGELSEHTALIIGEGRVEAQNGSGGANPFAPTPFATKKKE
ncbi:MAG TPA: efflux RND transporter periplasmic adaptor subunit [Gemmataceae bacterium]|jgi:HlyD family secretion protein|nr:efflux RND transporter periplasmic adaptor subunit [Gemmataceae bacterium]